MHHLPLRKGSHFTIHSQIEQHSCCSRNRYRPLIVNMAYVDHSREKEDPAEEWVQRTNENSFPAILHVALENAEKDGTEEVLSWQPHGRAFRVHDTEQLTETVLKL